MAMVHPAGVPMPYPFWPNGFMPPAALIPPFMPPGFPPAAMVGASNKQVDAPFNAVQRSAVVPRRLGQGSFVPRRLCVHWARNGFCRRGETCTFAHGVHELHPESQVEMVKSQGLGVAPPPSIFGGHTQEAPLPPVAVAVESHEQKKDFKFNVAAPVFLASPKTVDLSPCKVACSQPTVAAGTVETLGRSDKAPLAAAGSSDPPRSRAGSLTYVQTVEFPQSPVEQRPSLVTNAVLPGVSARRPRAATDVTEDVGDNPQQSQLSPVFIQANSSPAAAAARKPTQALPASPNIHVVSPTVALSPMTLPISPARKSSLFDAVVCAESTTSGDTVARSRLSSTSGIFVGTPVGQQAAQSPCFSRRSSTMDSPMASSPPQTIQRDTFLQARVVANRIQRGAPGLAAPSPTTAAKGLGFALPQPGLLRTQSVGMATVKG
eukprot:TRINITY_DN27459_c0_g1_i3.p1 TRINITY_DN27459_c0_g1~~TRINITY_DN27459_c0_g1_i3.p1  ORF type:complete len:434 (+),score=62.70 TRINITY_DN27459_c0_g1_i3:149-1450(+)